MSAEIIDGNAIAKVIQTELKESVAQFTEKYIQPGLAMILIGDNPASKIYVQKKRDACAAVGIRSELHTDTNGSGILNEYDLKDKLYVLNHSRNVHGILVQLPLPSDFDTHEVFDMVSPYKDVDVFNPENVGLLVQGRPRFNPCTPQAVQVMLQRSGISTAGKKVAIINRSNVVGKPLSSMLIQDNDYANATVTVCHDRTPSKLLKDITLRADIIIVAVGKPGFLTADLISPGAVVIDVGITRIGNKVVGDVDFENVKKIASAISPVPGGVGPLTVTMLLVNTLTAAQLQVKK